eukprot:Ihof_evm13s22 gene=Ihof_evmTU13s22
MESTFLLEERRGSQREYHSYEAARTTSYLDEERDNHLVRLSAVARKDHTALLDDLDDISNEALQLPVKLRQIRDVWGILTFGLFWLGMITIGILALKNGQPDRSNYGEDSTGNLCGYDNTRYESHLHDFRRFPYLQILDDQKNGPRVCLSACPIKTASANWLNPDSYVCMYNIVASNQSELLKLIGEGHCSPGVFATIPILHRCVPSMSSDWFINPLTNETELASAWTPEIADNVDQYGVGQRVVASLSASWQTVMGFTTLSGVLSFGWMMTLQHMASCLLWATILGVCACGVTFSTYLFAMHIVTHGATVTFPTDAATSNEMVLLAMAIISLVFTIVLMILVTWRRRELILSVAIIKEAGRAINDIPEILLVPLGVSGALIILFSCWGVVCINMASAGRVESLSDHTVIYIPDRALRGMIVYHILGLLWTVQLLIGLGQYLVAYAIVAWYFSNDRETPAWASRRKVVMKTAPYTLFRYHLGSVAIGSLLLALFQWIHWLFQLVRRQTSLQDHKVLIVGHWLAKCFGGVLSLLECVIRLINQNAYIEMALYGHGFFPSAKRALELLATNCLSYTTVQYVSDFYLMLGRMAIGLITAYAIGHSVAGQDNVDYFSVPML